MYTDSSDSNTSDRPPSQDSSEVTIARWRSRVASRSSPPSSTTHVLSPTDVHPPTQNAIKGVITASDYDDSTKESYEIYIEPNIDSNVQADIDADIVVTEAAAAREADVGVKVGIGSDGETMPTATRTGMTPSVIEEMIERRVAEALEAYEANKNRRPTMESGDECEDGNGDGGNGNGNPDMNVGGTDNAKITRKYGQNKTNHNTDRKEFKRAGRCAINVH
ncbi:hypothetical protein Tco_0975271 [Tanacetum coccineum]|uniref:Uncharacterized protein n=1 Tax=Tanacetum coccineum TaxID=301880 RepID=A0ABQ5EDW9_9ASTR